MDKLTLYEIYFIIKTLESESRTLCAQMDERLEKEDTSMFEYYSNDINVIKNILKKFKEEG